MPWVAPRWDAGASWAPARPVQPPYSKVIWNEEANSSNSEKKTLGEPQNEGSFPPPLHVCTGPKEHPHLAWRAGTTVKWIHITRSLEEMSSDVSGKIFPSLGKGWAKWWKETKVASWQAPPSFRKKPAQHGQPAALRSAKRKEKALPQLRGEIQKPSRELLTRETIV